jgi:hypothetical protein
VRARDRDERRGVRGRDRLGAAAPVQLTLPDRKETLGFVSGDLIGLALFAAAWWLLQAVILPKLGVPT